MARPLIIVAGSGIAISFISLSLASFLSPDDGRDWWRSAYDPWSGRPTFTESGDVVSRELNWSGNDSLEVDIPGLVVFEQAADWSVVATGRESTVEQLRIDGGRVTFAGSLASSHGSSIEVRIKGPTIRHIGLSGSGNVIVTGISERKLGIDIRGSGSVRGRGAVEKLELKMLGSGNAELADLVSEDVDISIYGSGDADVSASGRAEVKIVGSGDVRLSTTPRSLSTEVIGSGRVVQLHSSGIEPDD